MISRAVLQKMYEVEGLSAREIAEQVSLSTSGVNYWLKKYMIKKRSVSDAIYLYKNPEGNPFSIKKPKNIEEATLFGLGMGLYWGEGTKADRYAVRLGNTDPRLIKRFIDFLETFFLIRRDKLRFGLQIFTKMNEKEAMEFWLNKLGVHRNSFFKTTITERRGVGNYKNKQWHGVLTVYFNNKKLRDYICHTLEKM